jgi:acetyl esterase/lipase
MTRLLILLLLVTPTIAYAADSPLFPWPDLAPGETERATGTTLPMRPQENPPVTRVVDIRLPTIAVFPPSEEPNGTAVLVLPGGGFGKVVPDMEGSEAAEWLGKLGITTFVLNYRTTPKPPRSDQPAWMGPLQDAQRSMRWLRANASRWKLNPSKIGLLAYSAGGQVGSMLITAEQSAYETIDDVDKHSFRPDFAMLVYPWRIYDSENDALLPQIKVSKETPPSFIVHTSDDASTSLGSVYLYAAMKRNDVSAELHIYQNGGHGYGSRERPNSNIGTWSDRAVDWLRLRIE